MMHVVPLDRPKLLRGRRLRLIVAAGLVALTAALSATVAHAGTDTWCSSCNVNPGQGKQSTYDHHFTLIYSHDLSLNSSYVGAGVLGCFSIAHGYGVATHSYSTTCLAYGWGENTEVDWITIPMNIHGDF
jgi:hypothetical protein